MVFLLFNVLLIIISLLILIRWRGDALPFLGMKAGFLWGLPAALLLFPLGLLVLPQGHCFESWEKAVVVMVKFCVLYAALSLSVPALGVLLVRFSREMDCWSRRLVWGSAFVFFVVLMLYWWGTGTCTSFDFKVRQYPQILSGEYDLMHTLPHTLFCQAILAVCHHFSAIVLVQVLSAGVFISCLFVWARQAELSRCLVWGAAACIVIQFNLLTTIIKDVPYGISIALLCMGLCRYMLTHTSSSLWMIGLGLTGSVWFRYDGFVSFALTSGALVLCAVVRKREACRLWRPVLFSVACWMLSAFVLPWALGAVPGASGTKYAKMAHVICDVVAEGGVVSAENLAVIEREIKPLNIILNNYNIYQRGMHPIVSTGHGERYIWNLAGLSEEEHQKYSFAFALTGKGEIITKLFIDVARDNPLKVAKILIFNTQLTWNLPNRIHPRKVPHQYLLYYGFVLALIVAFTARRLSMLIPFVPFCAVPMVMMAAATTYEPRYLLPIELMFPVLLIYTVECVRMYGNNAQGKNIRI